MTGLEREQHRRAASARAGLPAGLSGHHGLRHMFAVITGLTPIAMSTPTRCHSGSAVDLNLCAATDGAGGTGHAGDPEVLGQRLPLAGSHLAELVTGSTLRGRSVPELVPSGDIRRARLWI